MKTLREKREASRKIHEVRALLGNPSGLTDEYVIFWIDGLGVYGAYRYIQRALIGPKRKAGGK